MDRVQQRLDRMPHAMTVRKSTVEHVFGTLKHWMGWTHFLTRGIENVSTVIPPLLAVARSGAKRPSPTSSLV